MDPTKPVSQSQAGGLKPEQTGAGPVPSSIGFLQKEQQPASSQEFLQPSEALPQLTKELEELGVEVAKKEPSLTEEHAAIGIEPAGESAPVKTQPLGIVQLPMTKGEALKTIKIHQKIGDSIRWLAKLILKQFRKQELREASDTI